MDGAMMQLGVGGIFVILVLREVKGLVAHLSRKRNGSQPPASESPVCPLDQSGAIQNLNWLREQFSRANGHGTFLWQTPREWKETIDRIAEHTEASKHLQEKMLERMKKN